MLSDFSFSKDSVGFIIEGILDTSAMENLSDQIVDRFIEDTRLNLYLEDYCIERISLGAITTAIGIPMQYASRFYKIALITDRKWIHVLGALVGFVTNVTIKSYATEKRMDAMCWITEKD